MSEADIRLQLAAEEEGDAARGQETLHEMTAAGMLTTLLDLEEKQYVTTVG